MPELNEFCYHIANVEMIQSGRGRSLESWSWLERGLDRLRRSKTRPAVAEYLLHRARATMAALGREPNSDWLPRELQVSPTNAGQGFHRLLGTAGALVRRARRSATTSTIFVRALRGRGA
ncbi:MAG: hypothetical protein KIS78_08225 [Labilithrix sp.]|nr:hypothetical protein [Labilithrix sp.]